MEFTRASQVATGVLFHSYDDIMELVDVWDLALLHLPFEDAPQITLTLSFFNKAVVVLEVWLGSLSCWNTALRPNLWREGIMYCFSMSQYMLAFMVPSMNCSSSVPAALMQPQTMTLPPPCLTEGKTHLSLYSSPGCRHTRLSSANCLQAFLCIIFRRGFLLGRHHADQFDAVCGVWSEHWQVDPHPFNLCSNAGSTHKSISQTQTLDMTQSTCTQLLWSTMSRPVLSGTCPVKPLYGLGHCAAAQFQGLGNLLIVYAIFM